MPPWAVDLMYAVRSIGSRLSRIEGGLILAAFLAGIIATLVAAHIVVISTAVVAGR